jgi:hypothetical protein
MCGSLMFLYGFVHLAPPFLGFRDEHHASVVRYDVLALRRKALLIMGGGISNGGKVNPA